MTVLICASRRFRNHLEARHAIVARVQELPPGTIVLYGGTRGGEMIAGDAAQRQGLEVRTIHGEWAHEGHSASALMDESPDLVLVFWGGRDGHTSRCVELAEARGIPVEVIRL